MPCPLLTETSWLRPEHYECFPTSAPHGRPQLERIPLDAFAIGAHCYQYVPRTSSEEPYHFEGVYGAVDQYLVTKVVPKWDTTTRMARRDKEAEHYKRRYGVGPENAGYEADSTVSMLAVAPTPLSSRRTSVYAQIPDPNSATHSSSESLARTCWTPRNTATSSAARPTPSKPREPAEPPVEPFTSSISVRLTTTKARTPNGGHAKPTAVFNCCTNGRGSS